MRQPHSVTSKRRTGFTLVELLVVIGIIALLISILLPSLNKAREAGRRVKCLSNMRQVAMAVNMFAQDNKGQMPARGAGTIYIINASGSFKQIVGGTTDDAMNLANWISYLRQKDPFSGVNGGGTVNTASDQNVTYSGLAKYLGVKAKKHSTADEANNMSAQLDSLFRCPSDSGENRPSAYETSGALKNGSVYRYSYAMNDLFTFPVRAASTTNVDATLTTGVKKESRLGGDFNGRISSIKDTGNRILIICEDPTAIDDGVWSPTSWGSVFNNYSNTGEDLLSAAHDSNTAKNSKRDGATKGAGMVVSNTRGNVVMADGHGEFLTRKEANLQIHSGSPFRDPDSFK